MNWQTIKFRAPYCLTLISMILGVFTSILFGINEDIFKDRIQAGLAKNQKIQSMMDPLKREAKLEAEAGKNWRYYQRFHFHSTGISAMTLGLLILLSFIASPVGLNLTSKYLLAVGGLLYPFVWLFAAIYGPEIGRHEAKEAFAFFGYMGGVFFLGLFVTLFQLIKYPCSLLQKS